MNMAKIVMAIYSLAAILSMMGIGVSASFVFMAGTDQYDTAGFIGGFACLVVMCIIFIMGFKQKRKFKEAGLL